jgi:predicted ATP-dependent Lon-type protease
MKDLHNLIREIKDSYDELGIVYTKDDVVNVLIKYYGLKPHQIEDLKLWVRLSLLW